jgi:ATP-binding cassette subfamily C protein CydCD
MDSRLLRTSAAARSHLLAAGVFGVLAAGLIVAQAALLANVIARAALAHATLDRLRPVLVALAAVLLARAMVNGGFELSGRWGATRVMSELRARLARRLLIDGVGIGAPGDADPVPAHGRNGTPLEHGAEPQRTGALAAAAVQGVDALESYFAGYLPQLILAALVPLAVLGYTALADPIAAGILAFTVPLLILFMVLIGRSAAARTDRRWQALALLSAHFLDVVRGLPTLRAHNRDRAQEQVLAGVGERYRDETMGTLRIAFLSALVLELCAMIGTALVAATIGVQLIAGVLQLQAGLAVLLLAPELYGPLRAVGAQFHASADGTAAAERIFAVLDRPPAVGGGERSSSEGGTCFASGERGVCIASGEGGMCISSGDSRARARTPANGDRKFVPNPDPRAGSQPGSGTVRASDSPVLAVPDPGRQPIRLRGVRFAYPGDRDPALDGVELELAPGSFTALVGPSGAGKSTLAALLMRLADPTGGAVECGGCDLRTLDPARWRARVAWVPQAPTLFEGTLAENIALARPHATPAEILAAARAAGAQQLIDGLPDGLRTVLGEGARRISAGQRRRVALARAFLADAPLLVLDEPTAHLDEASAADIARSVARLARGRTVLCIVHDPALAASADRVVELHDGRVAGDSDARVAASPVGSAGGAGAGAASRAGSAGALAAAAAAAAAANASPPVVVDPPAVTA